jgi:hypothetical protein
MHTEQQQIQTYVYHLAKLDQLGITREAFDRDPEGTLREAGQYDAIAILASGYRPLLPAQIKIRRELEEQWAREKTPALRRSSGATVVRTNSEVNSAERTTIAA